MTQDNRSVHKIESINIFNFFFPVSRFSTSSTCWQSKTMKSFSWHTFAKVFCSCFYHNLFPCGFHLRSCILVGFQISRWILKLKIFYFLITWIRCYQAAWYVLVFSFWTDYYALSVQKRYWGVKACTFYLRFRHCSTFS